MSRELKKVLILAYFFKPNSLTASNRPYYWVKYLHKFGYYPIVITRTWGDGKISSPKDIFSKGANEVKRIDKFDHYEVHYVTYKPNVRDKLFIQDKNTLLVKFFTLLALLTKGISNYFNEGKEVYNYAREIIRYQYVKKMIITANPFVMFKYGYLLAKEFDLKWIADYRDDWTTSELRENNGGFFLIVKRIDQILEKKWVRSASLVTSVSKHYTNKISRFVDVKGSVLLNGFEDFLCSDEKPNENCFTLCFNGTLYETQEVEVLIDGVLEFLDKHPDMSFKMKFPGLAFSKDQNHRVQNLIKGYEKYFWISDRIAKAEVLKIQQQSHLLVMINHKGLKGIPSSKLYEYLSLQRHILVVNGDNDIVDYTVYKANVGKVANSVKELASLLSEYWEKFKSKPSTSVILHQDASLFKIERSVKDLAEVLDSIN